MSKLFPIMPLGHDPRRRIEELRAAGVGSVIIGLPWCMIGPHETQARANHGQSLARLAERGGLGVCEALAVLDNRRWHRMDQAVAMAELSQRVAEFTASRVPTDDFAGDVA